MAGHPPVLHVRAATGTVEEVTTPAVPLGIFDDRLFTSRRISADAGDLLAIVTDGLTEVFDRDDVEFGLERLKETIRGNAALPLPEIAAMVLQRTREHGAQSDDQTLLLIRLA